MDRHLLAAAVAAMLLLPPGVPAQPLSRASTNDGSWFFLDSADIPSTPYHVRHDAVYGKYVGGYNREVLRAIDVVQGHAMDGGGYFIGIHATPTESPVGYALRLFGNALLDPPRTTSYCSGSTYAAFIETLNRIFPEGDRRISSARLESFRMQEPDGGRREDGIKYWGKWNDDGWGSQFALVQYSGMGEEIPPRRARPGDFMNIAWKAGNGHSVVFLGWFRKEGKPGLAYWSSQQGTNGMGDVALCPLDRVESVKIVRLAHPEKVFSFDAHATVTRLLSGEHIDIETR